MRLFPATSLVCVIDVQERLLAVIPEAERLVARVARLAEAAKILGVRRLLTEPDFAKTAGDFAAKYADETLDVRHSLDAYERLYADHDPAQWPADSEIKAAMKFAIIKRSMREMIPRSLRAQISGLINLRKKASVPE